MSINAAAVAQMFARPPDLTLAGVNAWVDYRGNSYRKGNGQQGPYREIEYLVAWDLSDAFIDALVMSVNSVGTSVVYKLPHQYPGNRNLWCVDAEGTPEGALRPDTYGGKLLAADLCRVRATYARPQFDVTGSETQQGFGGYSRPFARTTQRSYLESEPLDAGSLQEPDGDKLSKSFNFEYPVTELTIAYHMMPFYPPPSIQDLQGSLNSAAFLGYPAGRWKFTNLDVEDDYAPDGSTVFTWNMQFLRKPWDHNTRWSQTEGTGRVIAADGSGNSPYGYADLNACLIPAVAS